MNPGWSGAASALGPLSASPPARPATCRPGQSSCKTSNLPSGPVLLQDQQPAVRASPPARPATCRPGQSSCKTSNLPSGPVLLQLRTGNLFRQLTQRITDLAPDSLGRVHLDHRDRHLIIAQVGFDPAASAVASACAPQNRRRQSERSHARAAE